MAGYVGTKAVLLSTTAATVGGDADISGALDVGGAFTSQGIDDNATSTAMTLDASGNLLVGKTSADTGATDGLELTSNGRIYTSANGLSSMILNRRTTDGNLAQFKKDGSTSGIIGVAGSNMYIGSVDTGLKVDYAANAFHPCNPSSGGSGRDNVVDLGKSNIRFDDIYATNGTIQTSDRNEKQDIAELSDAEQRVAVAAKGLMRKFRWRDAVAEKGDDARTHFGIIAQDLQAAFVAEGLDAGRYAMFISTTWWETTETFTDEETGEERTRTITYDTQEEAPEGATERTRLGVRYSELLAFIIGAL